MQKWPLQLVQRQQTSVVAGNSMTLGKADSIAYTMSQQLVCNVQLELIAKISLMKGIDVNAS